MQWLFAWSAAAEQKNAPFSVWEINSSLSGSWMDDDHLCIPLFVYGDERVMSFISHGRYSAAFIMFNGIFKTTVLARPPLRHCFHTPWQPQVINKPNNDPSSWKVTEGCCGSGPHLWIDHTSLSAIWPLKKRTGEVVDTRRRRLKSALWSSEMFHFFIFFSPVGTLSRVWWGACLLIWMPEQENICPESGRFISLSFSITHSIQSSLPPRKVGGRLWGKLKKEKKTKKTTNINEVLHWEITMCALPDSICTSLMACAIMWASINIKAGTVTAKGFTSITAVPPLHVSISTQGKKYTWNTASAPGY